MRVNKLEDVWKHINVGKEDECWEWQGNKNSRGYGRFFIKRKSYGAHRIVYELTYGNISKGLCICHTCDNRKCVNPNHLFIGTYKDNVQDMFNKGRNPSQKGELHSQHKLTEENVKNIRKLYSTGLYSQRKLGKMFGVHQVSIFDIIHNISWKHI